VPRVPVHDNRVPRSPQLLIFLDTQLLTFNFRSPTVTFSAGGAFNSQGPLGWPSLSVLERVGHSFLFSPCRVAGVRIDRPPGALILLGDSGRGGFVFEHACVDDVRDGEHGRFAEDGFQVQPAHAEDQNWDRADDQPEKGR